MSANQQLEGGRPEWMPGYVDKITTLAENPNATFNEMSTAGADALWFASSFQEPDLIEPAETLLTRATAGSSTYRDNPQTYLGARLAHAFVAVHHDQAEGEGLRPESMQATYVRLTELMSFTADPPSSSVGQARYHTKDHLARAVYMGLLARTGDPSATMYPAPPLIQTNTSEGHTPHNSFLSIDGTLRACNLEQARPTQFRPTPGVINLFPSDAAVVRVQQRMPPTYAEFVHLPTTKRKERAVLYVARCMIDEAAGRQDEATTTFLNASSAMTVDFLRRKVQRVSP